MDTMQRGTVALLKSAITQQRCALPEGFDLEEAYPQLKRHHMAPLIYEGAVLCGIPKQLPVMQKLFQAYCRAMLISEGQMREVARICAAFDENGIDYMLLKGCKMKSLYPKPELRTMGDADILIRMEQYDRIVPIMQSLEFCAGVESDHELVWRQKGLFLELHKRVIPSYNKDFYAYFGEGWKLAVPKDGTCYDMVPEDEMVYLFTHFAKHYRDGGIGCRHVVDLWVFLRAHAHMDEEKVKTELDKLQLREFYENIRHLIAVWFEDATANEKMDFITDFIFASGSWGRGETHALAAGVRDDAHSDGNRARSVYLLRLIFPSAKSMQYKYTILQKAPWMLPLVWLYRPLHKLLHKREWSTLKTHKRNLQLRSAEKINTHKKALEYVGLDYHF